MIALILSAEKRNIYFRDPEGSVRHGNSWYPEILSGDPGCRVEAALAWKPIELAWTVGESPGNQDPWTDALGFGKSIRGFETLVSERACELLLPYVKSQCQFLPVDIAGAPCKYFILYVTQLLDCLDSAKSRLGRENPSGPRLVSTPRIKGDCLSGHLFRLAGGRGYQFDYDFATESFIAVVKSCGLTGFCVQEIVGAPHHL